MVQLGRAPITYPTSQPSESSKHEETGTSLYVGHSRLTKLVGERVGCEFLGRVAREFLGR
jgi:hypothetical protein